MASKTQQEVMVLDIGGAVSPAAAPDSNYPPRRFGQAGRVVQGSNGSYKAATVTGEADMQSKTSSGRPTKLLREDLLTPESTQRGIQVTLDNNNMWNEFFRCKTEMILTKQGSRMFPYCRFRISGLQPSRKYVLIMDIQLVDQSRYMWTGTSWKVAGKAEHHVTSSPFAHPESPSPGHYWMQNPVSFYKLKLTSNMADQEGNTILHPMHRYLPRLHVVQAEKATKDIKLNASNVATFTFQQTEFMAVTAYQNCQFSQLKVHYNPFAKGLREEGVGSLGPKLKSNPDGAAATDQQQPLKKTLKSLLANHKARSSLDTKSPARACVQEASSGSSPRVMKNSICNSRPAEKLIGDIIREAHISLTRCNMESLSASQRLVQTNTKTTAGKANSQDVHNADKKSTKSSSEPPPQGKSGAAHSVVVSEAKCQSEVQVMPGVKRPLPLPALALFLKKHSTKTKTVKSKLESASMQIPAEVQTTTGTASANQHGSISEIISESHQMTANVLGKESFQHISILSFEDTAASPEAIRSRTNDHVLVSPAPEPEKTVFPEVEEPLGSHKTLICSTLPTSPSSPVLSPLLDTELDAPHVPTATSSESKCGDFLSDTPCSPFGFESLSPASSPDPLPSLPATFALDLDSAPSKPSESLPLSKDSAPSVFKWHTVLPLPEPYVHPSFEVFQPTSQSLSLGSSLLPSQTLADVPSQSSELVHSDPSAVDSLSFQESEQPLPFPGELSPLALPLTLSPTFSSLDGDALSPMPSIADLVHFFSTEEHLGMGVEFPNTDLPTPPCPPDVSGEAHGSAHPAHVPMVPSQNHLKGKKKARRRKPAISDLEQKTDDSAYTTMKPNLEEVEEQLFISFTSKEALKLHIADSDAQEANSQLASSPSDVHLQQSTEENTHEDTIAALEQVLLKDVKMMKHQQIIHPVLQEVGLKMNLLDASLSIDLQYLGVRLPIPPPGSTLQPPSQELPPLQGTSGSFVSRTGKTTDVTQIKGWREKFSPSEPSVAPSPPKAEVCVSSEQPKKNLSAFCSDMLDQYLESEAKLIDQRVASFSQPSADSLPVYELPASSSSYVRTLGSVLKKQSAASPASDLISGFVPPSKRAKAPIRQFKASRKLERKQKSSKPVANPGLAPSYPTVPTSTDAPQLPAPLAEPPKPKKTPPAVRPMESTLFSSTAQSPPLERKKRLKRNLNATLQSHSGEDGADLTGSLKPALTRGLLRQKGLEDDAVWGGQPRTFVTEERASIALTSLFTLKGFVSDNPTAPILLPRRPEPACLNDFCRLGCVCSSLAYTARVSHCGRPQCMLGCSCLKQKVVLLKNLDGSDSSPSSHGGSKRKKRKRMKMAYILKEADSVSQPAERVRTLWNRDNRDSDLEQTHVPEASSISPCIAFTGILPKKTGKDASSCARVRRFVGKSGTTQQVRADPVKKSAHQTSSESSTIFVQKPYRKPKRRKKVRTLRPEGKPLEPAASISPRPAPSSPPRLAPSSPPQCVSEESRPSRRLTILTECRWKCDEDRDHVLKTLCEAMAQDRLDKVFWTRKYQINPISQTVEDNSTIHYKVLISKRDEVQQDNHTMQEVEPVEAWQREVTEEDFVEDWPQELNQRNTEEESGASHEQVHAGSEQTDKRQSSVQMGLPFLSGVSTAGFLSAGKKLPGGGNSIQVNGKMYPLAKIQLGEMGALHPANRLAAYLTGRVAATRKQRALPALPQPQRMSSPFSVLTCPTATSTSTATSTPTATAIAPVTSTSTTTSTSRAPTTTCTPTAASTPTATSITPTTSTSTTTSTGPTTFTPPAASMAPATSISTTTSTSTATSQSTTNFTSTVTSTATATFMSATTSTANATFKSLPTCTSTFTSTVTSSATATSKSPATSTATATSKTTGTSTPGPAVTYIFVPPPPSGSSMVPLPRPRITIPGPPRHQVPTSSAVRMILRQVQSTTGVRYYRRPDGKLVQLIPVSQLRATTPAKAGSKKPSVLTASSLAAPASSIAGPMLPSSASSLSGFKSFTVNRVSVPVRPDSTSLGQNTTTHRIISTTSAKNPVPGQVTAPDLVISEVRSVQPENKPVTLLNVPKDATTRLSGGTPMESEVTTAPPPLSTSPEPAMDLADLDVVCIVDDVGIQEPKHIIEEINLVDSSSDETDHSSDFTDESSGQEKGHCSVDNKQVHNALARVQRQKMSRMVAELRNELQLEEVVSTAATLHEVSAFAPREATLATCVWFQAVQVIEELRATEKRLKRKKMLLIRQRERLLAILDPSARDCGDNSSQTGSQDGVKDDVAEKTNHANRSDIDPAVVPGPPSPEPRPTSPATAASGGRPAGRRSEASAGDDVVFVSSVRKLPDERAPPAPGPVAPPPPSPKPAAVEPLAASRGAPAVRSRPKTMPNILSRCKTLAPPPVVSGDLASFQAILPAELLSVVGAALPGQPFLTLTPLMAPPESPSSSAATGTATVPLSLPGLTDEHAAIPPVAAAMPLPAPPPGSPAPLSPVPAENRLSSGDEGSGLNGHPPVPPPLLLAETTAPGGAAPHGEGVSWRPMPRLVPLGLRGAPPT
ncbi:MAX dimerization protein MGA a isoform X1 [Phycodurus eques]|uniref:MAX dimerization protein MGA a isoform X1 n=1 Tax=Phycodurus eques TaxID=693459 RepID=UPI002ACEF594|nr:MAX dimerization protein MGA a isoform X1 [Phycodurus eques]XP_061552232.1 MAX dimerization protein MGA a isoform X1 [Phycodurus eques]XP_061552233.1 MAX dimerization protein MGA a isoform X1 [Phycodurus eques]